MKKLLPIFAAFVCAALLSGCGAKEAVPESGHDLAGLKFKERVENLYADQFTIDRYEGGYSMIYTEGDDYLIVPEGMDAPDGLDGGVKIINRPVSNIYLAATAAMGLFDAIDGGGTIKFSGSEADEWYIDYAREAMEKGDMLYAGDYNEPDYEMLLTNGCKLSVQSTMIEYAPEVKEKLEELGITVLTDLSSYETHPLGRSEWIRVYAELLGKGDEADALMKEQAAQLDAVTADADTGKTVVFFYINAGGQAVTRKSGDYVSKMISLAGGRNVFTDLEDDTRLSTVKLEPERFYETAKDADILIYNSTIGGEIHTIDELVAKNAMLADFKAVKNGDAWCTRDSMYQETMKLGAIITDFHSIFTGDTENNPPEYLYRLEGGGE